MEALHEMSDTIFALKDKLTDAEFKKMSDLTKTLFEKIKAYEEKLKTGTTAHRIETESDSEEEVSMADSDSDSDSDSDFEIEEEVTQIRAVPPRSNPPFCLHCHQRCHLERVRLNGRSQQHMTCGNTEHPILRWLGGRAQGDWFGVRYDDYQGSWVVDYVYDFTSR